MTDVEWLVLLDIQVVLEVHTCQNLCRHKGIDPSPCSADHVEWLQSDSGRYNTHVQNAYNRLGVPGQQALKIQGLDRGWPHMGTKYYLRINNTKAYIISMCKYIYSFINFLWPSTWIVLNLCIWMSWIHKHWDSTYIADAEKTIKAKASHKLHTITANAVAFRWLNIENRPESIVKRKLSWKLS